MFLEPGTQDEIVLSGSLAFEATCEGFEKITDSYELEIRIDRSFPKYPPRVFCTDSRIPRSFHHLEDRSFCLGSPLALQLKLAETKKLGPFIQACVVPYLFSYSYFEKHNEMPYGELKHGNSGALDDYMKIYGVDLPEVAEELVFLTSLIRSKANRHPCPCGSGLRVGKCHNQILNELRKKVGRLWFRAEYERLTEDKCFRRQDLLPTRFAERIYR